MPHHIGDKVRLKRNRRGPHSDRGLITAVSSDRLSVRIDASSEVVTAGHDEVTNFSLAARKAWENMPRRNVGRPKGSRVCDRVSVTIRVERSLWERLREAEAAGVVRHRTAALNSWIASGLDSLMDTLISEKRNK